MRLLIASALTSFSLFALLGCSATVSVDGDGGGGAGECGPKPPSSGYCPPAWVCNDGEWQDTAGACPQPACPIDEPGYNSPCDQLGMQCSYESDVGECFVSETWYECTELGWTGLGTKCSPEIICPDDLPLAGSDCSAWPDAWDCFYDVTTSCDELPMPAYVQCDTADFTWSVMLQGSCEACDYADSAACESDAGCRWLVPGCGENPIAAERCAPVADCAPDSCGDGGTCTTYTVNPCWNELCDACGGDASICEPFSL